MNSDRKVSVVKAVKVEFSSLVINARIRETAREAFRNLKNFPI